jgi:polar amino acid transport system substrate-binding protein
MTPVTSSRMGTPFCETASILDRRKLLLGGAVMLATGWAATAARAGESSARSTLATPALLRGGVLDGDRLRIISSESVPLKSFRDSSGQPAGFAVDLAVEVARRAGFVPSVELMPWTRTLVEGRRGSGVIAALFQTPEREVDFVFSEAVFEDEVVLVVPKGAGTGISSVTDLIGRRVAAQNGAQYGAAFSAVAKRLTLELDSNPAQRLRKLTLRHLDAALFNPGSASVLHTAREAGINPDSFDILPMPLTRIPSFMALSRHDPERDSILERLNRGISSVNADGSVELVRGRYLT